MNVYLFRIMNDYTSFNVALLTCCYNYIVLFTGNGSGPSLVLERAVGEVTRSFLRRPRRLALFHSSVIITYQ